MKQTFAVSLILQQLASLINDALEEAAKDKVPWVLVLQTDGVAQYVANTNRQDGQELITALLDRWQAGRADIPAHYNPDLAKTAPADALSEDLVATAVADVRGELHRAIEKFPTWPTDPIHALAVLGEEFGELTQAVLQLTYEPHKSSPDQVHREAIQTAAMALRFAMSLHRYEYQRGAQHVQHEAPGEAA